MSDNRPSFYNHVGSYSFTCELPGSKQAIQFKPVTTSLIKKLLTYENETSYVIQERALDDLISSSVLTDGFNVDELYIYDRMFLLLELRKKTKGEIIEFQMNCPKCNSQSLNRINLDELDMLQPESLDNTIVDLMDGSVKVHLRHMKRKHLKQDMLPRYFPKKASENEMAYNFQVLFHACAIDKIQTPSGMDENLPLKDRMFFIEEIPMQEMEKIKKKVDEMGFGWRLEYEYACVHCKHKSTETVPIQQNFFG